MLQSMTGFGRAKEQTNGYLINVEIKSLNSKFLDAQVRLPKQFMDKELEVRSLVSSELVRGKISFSIELISQAAELDAQEVNKELFRSYYREYEALAEEMGSKKDDLFRLALHSPEVMTSTIPDDEHLNSLWAKVLDVTTQAIKNIKEFRNQEGANLSKELASYISKIAESLTQIELLDPQRMQVVKDRIKKHQLEIVSHENFDENRFEQEMIYYIEKLDISEEVVRLKNHLDYFDSIQQQVVSQGKKLGFISQEIGREINTIGSKASYVPVQKLVVVMKDELEKIKEQLLNVV